MNNSSTTANVVEEKKVNVDGIDINYVRTGEGEHVVLLIPGFMGSVWTHFIPQIEYLNNGKLTVIAYDQPGYGKSIPPNRTFPTDFYERDAIIGCKLMKILGFHKFTVLGFSGGGVSALILAALYPENMQKLVLIGALSYVTPDLMIRLKELGDINTWSTKERAATFAIYGKKYFDDAVKIWYDRHLDFLDRHGGDICKEYVKKIKCPTLITRGENDQIIRSDQADYLRANIMNSKVLIFENAGHNLHLTHPDEFKRAFYEFLGD